MSSNQNALNSIWSGLQATLPGQTQQPYDQYQYQNMNLWNNLVPQMTDQTGLNQNDDAFNRGLDAYTQQAGLAGQTAQSLSENARGLQDQAKAMTDNAGYTPQEQQGIKAATASGFAAPYASAANDAKMEQLRTGQSAGVGSNIASLARQRGQQISSGLSGLQQQFGQARIQGQQFGMGAQQGAAGLGEGAAQIGNQSLSLSQFPQQARLQRLGQQSQMIQSGAQLGSNLTGQNLSAYGTGLQGQLGLSGQRSGFQTANPTFGRTFTQGLAGSLGKISGSFAGGGATGGIG